MQNKNGYWRGVATFVQASNPRSVSGKSVQAFTSLQIANSQSHGWRRPQAWISIQKQLRRRQSDTGVSDAQQLFDFYPKMPSRKELTPIQRFINYFKGDTFLIKRFCLVFPWVEWTGQDWLTVVHFKISSLRNRLAWILNSGYFNLNGQQGKQ